MVNLKDRHIERIDGSIVQELVGMELVLENCVISQLDLNAMVFSKKVTINNCVIRQLVIYGCWFGGGLKFSNNIVLSDIDYQMGGHNNKEIEIVGNIFHGFFSFFDCHFDGKVIVMDNIFVQDSDLLAKEGKGFDNIFMNGLVVENNKGRLDVIK